MDSSSSSLEDITLVEEKSDLLRHLNNSLANKGPTTVINFEFGLGIIILTSLGLFGNILSSFVLTRASLKSSYSVLTISLTIVDSIYLFIKLIRFGIDSIFKYYGIAQGYTHIFLPFMGVYLRPLNFIVQTGSTYMTIALAVDRYIAVCHPSKARFFCTRKNAKIFSILVITFSILYNITRWFEFHSIKDEQGYYKMVVSSLREDQTYKDLYIFWGYFIVMFLVPFVSLFTLNILVWRGLQNLRKSFQTQVQMRDNSFSLMLFGIVIIFLICSSGYLILDILDYLQIGYSIFWSHFANFLLTINHASNFLIYCVCGQRFRLEFQQMLREWFGLGKPNDGEESNNKTVGVGVYEDFEVTRA